VTVLYRTEEDIIENLLNNVRELDEKFEQSVTPGRPIYGLQVMPGMVLLLQHHALVVKRFSSKEFLSEYDHFILVFPELLSIRAVRFSGKGKLDLDSSFLISKLSKQKGESSRIGRELIGSFITQGMLEKVNDSVLWPLLPILLALIRPFLKNGVLLPSPLSLIAHEILERGLSKKVFLSPCALTVILRDFKYQKRFPVLGKELQGLLVHQGNILAFDASQGILKTGQLKVFIPLERLDDAEFYSYRECLEKGRPVISYLLGVLVFEYEKPVMKPDTRGHFLALQEVPLQLDAEALAVYGKPHSFTLRSKLSLSRPSELYYAISCEKQKAEAFKQAVLRKISSLGKELNACMPLTELKVGDIAEKEFISKFFQADEHYVRLLAPSLLTLALTDDNEVGRILKALDELRKLSSLSAIEALPRLEALKKENPIIPRLLAKLGNIWKDSFENQRSFASMWRLAYVI